MGLRFKLLSPFLIRTSLIPVYVIAEREFGA